MGPDEAVIKLAPRVVFILRGHAINNSFWKQGRIGTRTEVQGAGSRRTIRTRMKQEGEEAGS